MRHFYLFLLICTMPICVDLNAQNSNKDLSNYQLKISRATDPIQLDGLLEENSWQNADVATDFWMQFPKDNIRADPRTEIRMTYDDKNVYIAAICYDVQQYVVQTLRRDANFFEGDAIGVVIDPVNNKSNGFLFGVSPYNVQAEDLLGAEASLRLSFSWDNRWYSEVTRYEDHYIVEMAIPFKTLRFKSDITEWGINFFRNDIARNQYHSWTPLPINFELHDIGYTGSLVWDKAPEKTGLNISAIPYTTVRSYVDKESPETLRETNVEVGVDAKVAVTSSLNLDLTVNPDFSQTDVDEQQTNLTRFSLRYPERRGFFLENNDLFTEFGGGDARPIFTRRIGLNENRMPVPITFGARLSGNINPDFRIGLLHMQTKSQGDDLGQNYSIAAFNQRLFARSAIRGYATNRQGYDDNEGWLKSDYGRNAGLRFNYMNSAGSWQFQAAMHLSDKSEVGLGTFGNVAVEHNGPVWNFRAQYWNVTDDYYADMGFFPRFDNYDAVNDTIVHVGWRRWYGRFGPMIRPKGEGAIVNHDLQIKNWLDLYPNGELSDRETVLEYYIFFRNTSQILIKPQNFETNLLFPTSFTQNEPLPIGRYGYSRLDLEYQSDKRKRLAITAQTGLGEYYNGTLNRFMLQLKYRRQPWGDITLGWEQNYLKLPKPYGETDVSLITAKSNIGFSNKLFWTTFAQYNTQLENFNINSRLQWRYRTMSDIFLIYTDNYSTSPFLQQHKNRALLIKVNYMFHL